MGPPYRCGLLAPFWLVEFWGGFQYFEESANSVNLFSGREFRDDDDLCMWPNDVRFFLQPVIKYIPLVTTTQDIVI